MDRDLIPGILHVCQEHTLYGTAVHHRPPWTHTRIQQIQHSYRVNLQAYFIQEEETQTGRIRDQDQTADWRCEASCFLFYIHIFQVKKKSIIIKEDAYFIDSFHRYKYWHLWGGYFFNTSCRIITKRSTQDVIQGP